MDDEDESWEWMGEAVRNLTSVYPALLQQWPLEERRMRLRAGDRWEPMYAWQIHSPVPGLRPRQLLLLAFWRCVDRAAVALQVLSPGPPGAAQPRFSALASMARSYGDEELETVLGWPRERAEAEWVLLVLARGDLDAGVHP